MLKTQSLPCKQLLKKIGKMRDIRRLGDMVALWDRNRFFGERAALRRYAPGGVRALGFALGIPRLAEALFYFGMAKMHVVENASAVVRAEMKLSRLKNPSKVIMLAEGWQGSSWKSTPTVENASCSNLTRTQVYAGSTANGTKGAAHNLGSNYCFSEGHSEFITNAFMRSPDSKPMWDWNEGVY